MNIEIKKSKKPIKYEYAIRFMESRLNDLNQKKDKDFEPYKVLTPKD